MYDYIDAKAFSFFSSRLTQTMFEIYDRDTSRPESDIRLLCSQFQGITNECQSPIEQQMAAGLLFSTNGYDYLRYQARNDEEIVYPEFGSIILPQFPVDKYLADFMIVHCHQSSRSYTVVECDGHAFHEKTKEQAARDKKRDRCFAKKEITVLRFSGSEIYRDLETCIDDVSLACSNALESILVADGIVARKNRASI